MTALSKIVTRVKQEHVDKVLINIVIRIKPCLDKVSIVFVCCCTFSLRMESAAFAGKMMNQEFVSVEKFGRQLTYQEKS